MSSPRTPMRGGIDGGVIEVGTVDVDSFRSRGEPRPSGAPPWVPDQVRQIDPRSESGKTKRGSGMMGGAVGAWSPRREDGQTHPTLTYRRKNVTPRPLHRLPASPMSSPRTPMRGGIDGGVTEVGTRDIEPACSRGQPRPSRAPPWVPDQVRQIDPRSESGKTKGAWGRRRSGGRLVFLSACLNVCAGLGHSHRVQDQVQFVGGQVGLAQRHLLDGLPRLRCHVGDGRGRVVTDFGGEGRANG